jgi:ketosteroid isomerase-like protein
MKRLTITLGALLFLASPVHAQTADEKGVLAANDALEKALSSKDIGAMEKVWAHEPYVVAIHPFSKTPDIGWNNVRKSWEDDFNRNSEFSLTMTDTHVHVNGNTAIVVGVEHVQAKRKSGEEAKFDTSATNIFEKHGSQWLAILHQATVAPGASGPR